MTLTTLTLALPLPLALALALALPLPLPLPLTLAQVGHEVGGKPYQYPGQCVFFGKMQDSTGHLTVTNLCSTVQDWLLDAYGVPWNIGDGTWLGFGFGLGFLTLTLALALALALTLP